MGSPIRFHKMQGVGNDFVVVDGREHPPMNWSRFSMRVCDRRFGIGADGLLVLDHSESADILMRMFNPDGTPDVCGNGMRCVARFEYNRLRRSAVYPEYLTLETLAGIRTARPVPESEGAAWKVEMGAPKFDPADIPMRADSGPVIDYPLEVAGRRIPITALSTGTTHTVIFTDSLPDDEEFFHLSPALEHHPLFPERTSVMWTRAAGQNRLELRIWERGAGETWGCGTGACAAAVAAIVRERTSGPVRVVSKGGELIVEWNPGEQILLTGPAEYVYRGEINANP